MVSAEHNPVEKLERWRYWMVGPDDLRNPHRASLLPGDPKDKVVWSAGENRAICRHDPTHKPPQPGCSCGLYAVSYMDIRVGMAINDWEWRQRVRAAWVARRQLDRVRRTLVDEFAAPPDSPSEQVSLVRSTSNVKAPKQFRHWMRVHDPRNLFVIGRAQMHNAVLAPERDGALPAWRAESVTIDGLFFEPSPATVEAGCDVEELAAALSDRYGWGCTIGFPPMTDADMALFTEQGIAAHPNWVAPSWHDLGLYPPGMAAPKPRRFGTASLSGSVRASRYFVTDGAVGSIRRV